MLLKTNKERRNLPQAKTTRGSERVSFSFGGKNKKRKQEKERQELACMKVERCKGWNRKRIGSAPAWGEEEKKKRRGRGEEGIYREA